MGLPNRLTLTSVWLERFVPNKVLTAVGTKGEKVRA